MEVIRCFCLDVLNMARVGFNDFCHNQEAWQVVAYTISLCYFFAWSRQFWESLTDPTLFGLFRVVRAMPWVRRKVEGEMERVKMEMEEEIHQHDRIRDFYKFLPEHRAFAPDVLAEAEQYVQMSGHRKAMALTANKPQETEVYAKLFELFRGTDPAKAELYPGARKMEAEVVRMVSSLFHASPDACGVIAGGASEALLLACTAYRNAALRGGALSPSIIAPSTAPPILDRAASLFQISIVRIPVDDNGEYEASAVRRAINKNVCMVVACAPNPVTGAIDPIEKIAEVTQAYGIPLHVDCSVGGFLLPFMEHCDYRFCSFDFRLPGVTSISVDLQQYGHSPSPCSVLIYRDSGYIRDQCCVKGISAGGPYASTTLKDSRDGSAVAGAWATLLINGRDGYLDACQKVVETTRQLTEMLENIEGLVIKGYGDLCIVTFSHEKIDIYDVVDSLRKKGWDVDPLLQPVAARIQVTQWFCEDGVVDSFVQDVISIIRGLLEKPTTKRSKLSSLYKMIGSVSDHSLADDVMFLRLMAHYSTTPSIERRSRTLSVEGRKISMIAAQEASKALQELRQRAAEKNKI